jgi:hypothetical protein
MQCGAARRRRGTDRARQSERGMQAGRQAGRQRKGKSRRGRAARTYGFDKVLQAQLDRQGRLPHATVAEDHQLVQHHSARHDWGILRS